MRESFPIDIKAKIICEFFTEYLFHSNFESRKPASGQNCTMNIYLVKNSRFPFASVI